MIKGKGSLRRNLEIAKRGCLGKIGHKSMLAAEYILSQMKGKDSDKLEIYKCKFCHLFHIGHNRKKEKKSVKKENSDKEA